MTLTFGKQKLDSDKSNDRGKYKIFFATHDTIGNYRTVASERKITKNDGDKLSARRAGRTKSMSSGRTTDGVSAGSLSVLFRRLIRRTLATSHNGAAR